MKVLIFGKNSQLAKHLNLLITGSRFEFVKIILKIADEQELPIKVQDIIPTKDNDILVKRPLNGILSTEKLNKK